mmetsp:Transcript_24515/g.35167  ORF Transcript_24515/g.35167 Transcript_24515/m.35167 type:complete len:252 (+) Transcript_24515:461-1216(+)
MPDASSRSACNNSSARASTAKQTVCEMNCGTGTVLSASCCSPSQLTNSHRERSTTPGAGTAVPPATPLSAVDELESSPVFFGADPAGVTPTVLTTLTASPATTTADSDAVEVPTHSDGPSTPSARITAWAIHAASAPTAPTACNARITGDRNTCEIQLLMGFLAAEEAGNASGVVSLTSRSRIRCTCSTAAWMTAQQANTTEGSHSSYTFALRAFPCLLLAVARRCRSWKASTRQCCCVGDRPINRGGAEL